MYIEINQIREDTAESVRENRNRHLYILYKTLIFDCTANISYSPVCNIK